MDLMKWFRLQWDRVAAWVAVALGLLVLLLGWIGVSGTEFPAEQIPYIVSGGLLGVFLLGLGAVLWLSADLRDEWRKLDRIEQVLQGGAHPLATAPPITSTEMQTNGRAGDVAVELEEAAEESGRRGRRRRSTSGAPS
jgi:hypothetical protein